MKACSVRQQLQQLRGILFMLLKLNTPDHHHEAMQMEAHMKQHCDPTM